jgi:hypothetical protein
VDDADGSFAFRGVFVGHAVYPLAQEVSAAVRFRHGVRFVQRNKERRK